MAMNDEEITDEVLVKELERIRAIRAMSTDSSSNRTSSACLDAVSTAEVPDTQDLDDVWDLDDEEPELDLELDLNTSNGQRSRFFNDAGPAMCDSPMSESCGEGWGPPSSTHSPALQPLPHPSNRPSSPTTSPPSPVPSRPSLPRPLSDIQPSTSSMSRSTFKRLSKTRTTGGDESTSRKPVSSWKGGFESSPSQPAKPSPTSSSSDSSSSSSSTSSTSSSSSSSSATSPASSISGCASSPTTSTFTSTTTTPSVSKSTTPATASPPTSFPGCPGKGKAASAPSSRSHSFAGSVNLAQLSSMHGIPMALVERSSSMHSSRKPAVRDLAILPTQRVMRYVLLFRDLLASTASNSQYRIIVESAAQAADRIARKCDRAQNNAAFIVSPSPSHSNKDPLSASKSTKFQKTKATDGLKPSVSARLRKEGEKEKEKEPKVKEKDKLQTVARKLTKPRERAVSHSRRQSEALTSAADPSNAQSEDREDQEEDDTTPRRRSCSYSTTSELGYQLPRSSSSQRLSVLGLSVATIGHLLGRSQTPEPNTRSAHPPSAFTAKSMGGKMSSPPTVATFAQGAS
ncbi:hypothetical protein CC1G_13709 [Coprinopsis cinerea okayama7|uniref:DH domain-containing protein n=1 Tax=Coprinopsis cinerea (strain Okayama-7 / 130 / ATCC MYA-4618 / FGSC 9003) TaxID=240176 RepID=D6RK47_COPC7|nr:hypothetical protein CC1G_13709 [Coprinopsis cinerea okayama7\|eukprot:XP_002912177.1 hypothetical protein CC1G_13709 [Coprinopsis cinerea okayama7\